MEAITGQGSVTQDAGARLADALKQLASAYQKYLSDSPFPSDEDMRRRAADRDPSLSVREL